MEACGEPNAALCFDTWHWMRQPGGPDVSALDRLDGSRLGYLQLCDAAAEPAADVFAEAMTNRQLPGDGIVDFVGLFDVFDAKGARPYVASEIFNASILERGPAAAAAAYHDACARL